MASDGDEDMYIEDDDDYDLVWPAPHPLHHYTPSPVQQYSTDSNSEPDAYVDLENQYYNSKALKEEDSKAALEGFRRVLELEGQERGEWGFKALKQMMKLHFKMVHSLFTAF